MLWREASSARNNLCISFPQWRGSSRAWMKGNIVRGGRGELSSARVVQRSRVARAERVPQSIPLLPPTDGYARREVPKVSVAYNRSCLELSTARTRRESKFRGRFFWRTEMVYTLFLSSEGRGTREKRKKKIIRFSYCRIIRKGRVIKGKNILLEGGGMFVKCSSMQGCARRAACGLEALL